MKSLTAVLIFTILTLKAVSQNIYPNGQIKSKGDKINGEYITYSSDGKITMKGNYLDAKEQGEWIWYYDNGGIRQKVGFRQGRKNGPYVSYYENGQTKLKIDYVDGWMNGYQIEYGDNGKILSTSTYRFGKLVAEGDKINGPYKVYDENKVLIGKMNYVDGKRNGQSYYYNHQGVLIEEGEFLNDMKNGEWIIYFDYFVDTNMVESKTTYQNDKKNGPYIKYASNGNIEEMGNYINDWKQGEWVYYSEEGYIEKKILFNNGYTVATWIKFYSYDSLTGEFVLSGKNKNGEWVVINTTTGDINDTIVEVGINSKAIEPIYNRKDVDIKPLFTQDVKNCQLYLSNINRNYWVDTAMQHNSFFQMFITNGYAFICKKGVQGHKFTATFIINKDGNLSNISVGKSGNEVLNIELVRIIGSMNTWSAGRKNGQPVSVMVSYPIE